MLRFLGTANLSVPVAELWNSFLCPMAELWNSSLCPVAELWNSVDCCSGLCLCHSPTLDSSWILQHSTHTRP